MNCMRGVYRARGGFRDVSSPAEWPPKDPMNHYNLSMDPEDDDDGHEFNLPDSPWTYGEENLNPSLRTNKPRGISSHPPYHPDYVPPESDDEPEETSNPPLTKRRVRRGSEGYEVEPVDREEILRRYIASRGEEVGRYRPYTPDSEERIVDSSDTDEDNRPLAAAQAYVRRD